ncbi:hypothetical protein LCC91_04375 [Tepidimonas taiwanensis]|nr:hypothetical protein [Tepidimonas taiwanensis]UBQ06334.1 hypothetical protein LCC91_04375 [Tepidimonas taiwanensis]
MSATPAQPSMLETLFAFVSAHAWAQWLFVAFLFLPPMVIVLVTGQRGLASLATVLGWWALVLMLALAMV